MSKDGFGIILPVLLWLLFGGPKSNDDGPLSLPFLDGVREGSGGRGPLDKAK